MGLGVHHLWLLLELVSFDKLTKCLSFEACIYRLRFLHCDQENLVQEGIELVAFHHLASS